MNNLKPIKLLPARERVVSALRKAILTKELPEKSVITLEGIATQLGVSITPVREAFQILNREGLIIHRHNKGAEVLALSHKFIQDHYETRAILECACVAYICRNAADTKEIEEILFRSEKELLNGEYLNYSNYNQAFHVAIWEAAGNNRIKNILSEMWNGLAHGHDMTEQENAKISIREHKNILDALTVRDEKLASELMNKHIMRNFDNVLTILDSDGSKINPNTMYSKKG